MAENRKHTHHDKEHSHEHAHGNFSGLDKISNPEAMLQKKFLEFQVLEQKMKQLDTTIQNIDMQLMDVRQMQRSVSDIANIESGKKALLPLANGIFVHGTIDDNSKVLLNVGSNVIVEKGSKEAVALLEKQVAELTNLRQQMLIELQKTGDKMQAMEAELQKLVS